MKINREKLIQLLSEKTTMEPEEIDSQLSELISRIRETSEKGKALEIKGFGMFYFSEDGDLRFDPSDELKTEVNFKYAGMEPVEIKKPLKTTEGYKKDVAEPGTAEKPEQHDSEKSSIKDKKKTVKAETFSSKAVTSSPSKKKKEKDRSPHRFERAGQKDEKNPAATLITSIVIILAIVIGIILALDYGFLEQNNSGTSQQQGEAEPEIQTIEPSEVESPEMSSQDQPVSTDDEAEEEGEEEPDEPIVEDDDIEEAPEFGLFGPLMSIDGRFYTIVIHSFREEDDAREAGEDISSEGYRTVVANVDVANIGNRWRVGIGQFESISQAQQAAKELPRRYRENLFIGLIR